MTDVVKKLNGQDVNQLITTGYSKLASLSVGAGGAPAAAPAGGASATAPATEKGGEKKEEKKEKQKEPEPDMDSKFFFF